MVGADEGYALCRVYIGPVAQPMFRLKGVGMNLYLVTCISDSRYSYEKLGVYVVASNPALAEKGALDLMHILQYRYDDRVDKIELVASVAPYKAAHLLVVTE